MIEEDLILNEDLLEEEEPEICDCGECRECIEREGQCDCGDCDMCESSEIEKDLLEEAYDDIEPEDII